MNEEMVDEDILSEEIARWDSNSSWYNTLVRNLNYVIENGERISKLKETTNYKIQNTLLENLICAKSSIEELDTTTLPKEYYPNLYKITVLLGKVARSNTSLSYYCQIVADEIIGFLHKTSFTPSLAILSNPTPEEETIERLLKADEILGQVAERIHIEVSNRRLLKENKTVSYEDTKETAELHKQQLQTTIKHIASLLIYERSRRWRQP